MHTTPRLAEHHYEAHTQRVHNLRQEIVDLFARMRKLRRTLDEKMNAAVKSTDANAK